MAINLKKNERALLDAYNDVVNDKTDTKWAVFGYEGNSNDLKVVETGDGDLEEMTEELSGGKVMYAFIQVTDPNTQLPKNVLVNWAGEGVPPKLKGAYARHTPDVAKFLRGAHVTINARSEMDLDEDEVMKKVATASGAKFSVHKEKARAMPAAGPVGSVYKRADPTINTKARDEFWDKAERDEESRRKQEKLTAAQERKKEEDERRERERQEGTQREKAAQERARRIDQQKQQESAAVRREREEQEAQLQARLKQRETEIDSEREREQRQRQQRSNIGATDVRGKKSVFEQKAAEQSRPPVRPPPKKVVRPPPAARREPSPPPKEPSPPPVVRREPSPPVEREPSPPMEREPSPPPVEREPSPPPIVRRDLTPPREPTPQEDEWGDEPEQPTYDDVEGAQAGYNDPPEPEQPLYDDVDQTTAPQEDYYSTADQPQEDYYASADQPADDYPPEPEQELYDDVQQPAEPEQDLYDDVQGATGTGLTAKTIYDYQADDDTEISFDVDEIITDIEQIDEGWWRGTRQLDGSFGLFPANYVELV